MSRDEMNDISAASEVSESLDIDSNVNSNDASVPVEEDINKIQSIADDTTPATAKKAPRKRKKTADAAAKDTEQSEVPAPSIFIEHLAFSDENPEDTVLPDNIIQLLDEYLENESSKITANIEQETLELDFGNENQDICSELSEMSDNDFEEMPLKKSEQEQNEEEFITEENSSAISAFYNDNAPSQEIKEQKNNTEEKQKNSLNRFLNSTFDFIEMFVFTLVAVIIITSFIIRPSVVDGGSMLNTLEDGETLLISNFMYSPKQYDIVVVEDYSTTLKKPIVKRIIALENDKIKVTANTIYVNDVPIDDSYVFVDWENYTYDVSFPLAHADNPTLRVGQDYYELVVPDGEIFVMGDHRNMSTDSREIGTIDEDAIIGRALIRILPFDRFGKIN